ncbi:peroxisomal assembly protein [Ascosphaera acerosa]|nr:peroxisomal assembly protein [Ascosphaera acerosa]
MSFPGSSRPNARQRNARQLLRHSDLGSRGPVVARLSIDNAVRGETGIVEGNLGGLLDRSIAAGSLAYVAIAPYSPHPQAVEDQSWSIIPVRLLPPHTQASGQQSQGLGQSQSASATTTTIHVPGSASSLQAFLKLQSAVATRGDGSSAAALSHGQGQGQGAAPRIVECFAIDVVPIGLETVYVTVERHLIRNIDQTQDAYAGGFAPGGKGAQSQHQGAATGKASATGKAGKRSSASEREERLKQLVRKALGSQQVVRVGSEVALPLPSHPITYAPAPPVKVAFCEPLAQGLLQSTTRIVLIQTKPKNGSNGWRMASGALKLPTRQPMLASGHGQTNGRFLTGAQSTAESPTISTTGPDSESDADATEDTSSHGGSGSDSSESGSASDSGSDDSFNDMEDMISLAAPELMSSPASTPRAALGQQQGPQTRVFDVHTPRSYLSTSTARAASGAGMMGRSKIFKPEGLVRRVPPEFLHPKPSAEEDEDAVIYVDVHNLAKVGCFSGDWVRLEATGDEEDKLVKGVTGLLSDLKALRSPGGSNNNSSTSGGNGPMSGAPNAMAGTTSDDTENYRIARVYGVANLSSQLKARSLARGGKGKDSMSLNVGGLNNRRASTSSAVTTSSARLGGPIPSVLASPLLLHNLGNPKLLKITPFSAHEPGTGTTGGIHSASSTGQSLRRDAGREKSATPQIPPSAKEVTLHKVSSPVSLDRALQSPMFAALKSYFESRKRLVKSGDLIGVVVDEGLGRIISSGGNMDDDVATQLTTADEDSCHVRPAKQRTSIAWFRVSNVTFEVPDSQDPDIIHQAAVSAAAWGGVAMIDVSSTRMVTAGSETSRVPGTLSNSWEFYLGAKRLPRVHHDQQSAAAAMSSSTGGLTSMRDLTNRPVVYAASTQHRLKELVAAATSPRAIKIGMPPVVILLHSTQRAIGKATLASRACAEIGLHVFDIDAYDILTDGGANGGSMAGGGGDMKTEAYFKARTDRALACGADCTAILLRHVDVLGADRMVTAFKETIAQSRVVIATTTEVDKVAEGIRAAFTHEMEVTAPEEKEREGILTNVVNEMAIKLAPEVDLGQVAVKTAALVAGDLVDVVERAIAARTLRLERLAEQAASNTDGQASGIVVTWKDIAVAGGPAASCLTKADFDVAVEHARKNFADSIGAPKIPNVSWDDVGGLSHVKEAVTETIQLPLERPELFAKGMKKRSGILFYGPPGTGKTLLAKAIATEFSLNFFSVKGPELLNMYIGESEANVRRVFQRARDARPCCVFFDELDSVAPKRGNQGDSGGVMDRIVSQLLAELDGMSGGGGSSDDAAGGDGGSGGSGVFVIGATNRPDLLDPALLRPGRFDKMLYLGVSDTHAKQATILEALTRKFTLNPAVDLTRVADRLPLTYTGADLYALCSDAMLKAVTRKANAVDEKIRRLAEEGVVGPTGGPVTTAWFFDHLATPDDIAVMVSEEDFQDAQAELVASVSAKELEHFERIRKQFESSAEEQAKDGDLQASTDEQIADDGGQFLGPDGFDGLSDGQVITIDDTGVGLSALNAEAKGDGRSTGKGKERDTTTDAGNTTADA